MAVLPAIPIVALGLVAVWFFWPTVADPVLRAFTGRRAFKSDADSTADDLFRAWSERA